MPMGQDRERIQILASGLVRPQEAARFLGFSAKTLANWRYEGKGPKWVRRGGRIFYEYAALKAWR
jgi:predicted site-specific integrase-resolvase